MLVHIQKRIVQNVAVRFAEVELRIGSNDESAVGVQQLAGNQLVGFYPGANLEPMASFELLTPARGRFLTLQILSVNFLEISEISVFNS